VIDPIRCPPAISMRSFRTVRRYTKYDKLPKARFPVFVRVVALLCSVCNCYHHHVQGRMRSPSSPGFSHPSMAVRAVENLAWRQSSSLCRSAVFDATGVLRSLPMGRCISLHGQGCAPARTDVCPDGGPQSPQASGTRDFLGMGCSSVENFDTNGADFLSFLVILPWRPN